MFGKLLALDGRSIAPSTTACLYSACISFGLTSIRVSSPSGGESRPPLDALRLQDRPPSGLDRDPAEPKPGSSGENRLQLRRLNSGWRYSWRRLRRGAGSATPTRLGTPDRRDLRNFHRGAMPLKPAHVQARRDPRASSSPPNGPEHRSAIAAGS